MTESIKLTEEDELILLQLQGKISLEYRKKILEALRLKELVENLREACNNSSTSDVFSNVGKSYMKDLVHELDTLLQKAKEEKK